MMRNGKKVEIAKKIAIINYLIESKTELSRVDEMKIIELLADIADLAGGIKMLNTVQKCLEVLRNRKGGAK